MFYQGQRKSSMFDPKSTAPFKLSRSKIDAFIKCPRCFYLDRRLGIGQPPSFPFNLNKAVDTLLKKEFDIHRANKSAHPLMTSYGLDAVPYQNENLDTWRDAFNGIQFLHTPTNFIVYGGVDDVWVNPQGELIIVDYKATSKDSEVNLDAAWQDGYKRQVEIYQWLFRQNGFKVSDTAFFVYCNGKNDLAAFDAKLEFDIKLIPYTGKTDWMEKVLMDMKSCLIGDIIPEPGKECEFCMYRKTVREVIKKFVGANSDKNI